MPHIEIYKIFILSSFTLAINFMEALTELSFKSANGAKNLQTIIQKPKQANKTRKLAILFPSKVIIFLAMKITGTFIIVLPPDKYIYFFYQSLICDTSECFILFFPLRKWPRFVAAQ